MLCVRFLSSLSPPWDTFATLSKVYRPSQTPHPAVSSKERRRTASRSPPPRRGGNATTAPPGSRRRIGGRRPPPPRRGEKGRLLSLEACWMPGICTRACPLEPRSPGGEETRVGQHRARRPPGVAPRGKWNNRVTRAAEQAYTLAAPAPFAAPVNPLACPRRRGPPQGGTPRQPRPTRGGAEARLHPSFPTAPSKQAPRRPRARPPPLVYPPRAPPSARPPHTPL